VLDRHDLTDEEWARLEPVLPDQTPRRGGRWADHRTVINGVFWRTRCGLPWRDVPPVYGTWKTVYNRHRRWSGDGTWVGILDELRRDADVAQGCEWTVGVDAGVVRAHQHAATRAVPGRVDEQDSPGRGHPLPPDLEGHHRRAPP
jgi:Transposase and inactivated derivatives